jgi:hypothetical protein
MFRPTFSATIRESVSIDVSSVSLNANMYIHTYITAAVTSVVVYITYDKIQCVVT